MGLGKSLKHAFKKIRKYAIDPIKKTVDGEYLVHGLAHMGVLHDGATESYEHFIDGLTTAGEAIGGVVLSPMTGGASLGMTYGALSGTALSLMKGASLNDSFKAGTRGGLWGAAGGALTYGAFPAVLSGAEHVAGIASKIGGASVGNAIGTGFGNLGMNSTLYGLSGAGAAYSAGYDTKDALKFGLGSTVGATAMMNHGALATMAGAGAGGYGMLATGGTPITASGSGGGGNYQAPQGNGADPNAGGTGQSNAGKSVPQAEFLDGGGTNWGNSGMGGMFGGLDDIHNKDKFINTDKMKNLYAQRKLGAFIK